MIRYKVYGPLASERTYKHKRYARTVRDRLDIAHGSASHDVRLVITELA